MSLQRPLEYEGVIHRCPHCGEALKSFAVVCPACGIELRGNKASEAVKGLSDRLESIEAERDSHKKGFLGGLFEGRAINEADRKKIGVIQSFPIPNTMEDLREFMLLAASSVEASCYSSFHTGLDQESRRALSDAWLAKMEQIIRKAELAKCSSRDIDFFSGMLEDAKRKIRKAKAKGVLLWVALLGWAPAVIAWAVVSHPARVAGENERLEQVVLQVEESLDSGEYLKALRYAESLDFDDELDEQMDSQWDIERECWVWQVVDAAEEHGIDLKDKISSELVGGSIQTKAEAGGGSDSIEKNIDKMKQNFEGFSEALSSGEK